MTMTGGYIRQKLVGSESDTLGQQKKKLLNRDMDSKQEKEGK